MSAITILQGEPTTLVVQAGFDPATMVVEQPREAAMDPQSRFWNFTRTFHGLWDTLAALSPTLGGIQSIRHTGGDWYALTAQFSGLAKSSSPAELNAQIQTVWSLDPARLTKDLWHKPSVAAVLERIPSPVQRAWLRTAIETLARGEMRMPAFPPAESAKPPKVGSKSDEDINITSDEAFKRAGIANPRDLAELEGQLLSRSKGVSAYPVSSVVLRKTRIAPPAAPDAAPDFAGFGRIFTTAALLRLEPSITPIIRTGILAVTAMKTGYWLKEMPGLAQRDATRVDVETHWTFTDDFDDYVYGPAIT
jgi:hypothetical protein